MKKQLFKILLIILFLGCNNIDYKPKYKDFANDWESENLNGKVKKLEQYKSIVTNSKTGKTDEPVIQFKTEYTKTGNISYREDFDSFGKLQYYISHSYDNNDFRIKSITESTDGQTKLIVTSLYDSLTKKPTSGRVISGDTSILDSYFKYDNHGSLIQQTDIQDGDTTISILDYKYDNHGRIVFKKQADIEKNEYTSEFRYDPEGNLIELIGNSDFPGEMKSIYEYDSENRITKITDYISGQIEKETSFDKFYNETMVRFYSNNAPLREMQYDYEYDKTGNWKKRNVFLKDYNGDKKSNLICMETREIEYY